MAKTIILSEQRVREGMPEESLRGYDREELVKLFLAFSHKPYKVTANDAGVTFFFVEAEIHELKMRYFGNETILADWKMFVAADSQWRDFVVMWKSELRGLYPERYSRDNSR